MKRSLLIEEFHVSMFLPRRLSAKEGIAIRRTLKSSSFRRRLHESLQGAADRFTPLNAVTIKISR